MDKRKGYPPINEVFFALCKSVDTPVSLGCWLRFKFNQLDLASFEVNPRNYLDSASFKADYQCIAFLSKYKGLNTGLDLEAEAMKKFTTSEAVCKRTNERFKSGRATGFTEPIEHVLHIARRKIARMLGVYSFDKISPGFGWGPGATNDVSRRAAFVDTKMCQLPISVTPRAFPYLGRVLHEDLHWTSAILDVNVDDVVGPFSWLRDKVFSFTEACNITTVTKNAKTHRVIAIESRASAFLQKGVGSYFRKRLKYEGIDLDDQSANQRGACEALRAGLATLDLRAASDTVSLEVVFDLLPIEWAIVLDDLRSREAVLPNGETIRLEKFSSMGNGFTFELETLIFYALSFAVQQYTQKVGPLLVYGDDIIVPKKMAKPLINILGFCGFSINTEKSYITGLFFESCGRHYFDGVDVTPCYQKEVVLTIAGHIRLANRLLRAARRLRNEHEDLHRSLMAAWNCARREAGGGFFDFQLPFGVDGDEGYLVFGNDFSTWDLHRKKGKVVRQTRQQCVNMGLRCPVLRQSVRSFPANDRALLAHSLRRGVVTELPYLGFLETSDEATIPVRGWRWVMPTGEFGLVL
jgi:hypothetical protein